MEIVTLSRLALTISPVVLEVTAVDDCAIAGFDYALPMVLASKPGALIQCTVLESFSALSCDLPIVKLTFIDVTIFILNLAITMIHTASPITYVPITFTVSPAAFTLPLPINEHALEYFIIRHLLLALSIWLVIGILAFEGVLTSGVFSLTVFLIVFPAAYVFFIARHKSSFTMPHVIHEGSCVAITVAIHLFAVALALVINPIAIVDGLPLVAYLLCDESTLAIFLVIFELACILSSISKQTAISVSLAIRPVTIILAAICVGHFTLALDDVVLEQALVFLACRKLKCSVAMLLVILPVAAVVPAICVSHVPFAMHLILRERSRVFITIEVLSMALSASLVILPSALVESIAGLVLQRRVINSSFSVFLASLELAFVDGAIHFSEFALILVKSVEPPTCI